MTSFTKTRILYVNHTGHMSGAERVLIDTLKGLDRDRYEPFVMCPMYGDLTSEICAAQVDWAPLPAIRVRFTLRPDQMIRSLSPVLKAIRALRKQIHACTPDLIHANSVRAGLVATLAAAGTRTPVIWHVHDTLPRHPLSTALRLFVLAARGTQVIAVSRATAQRFIGHVPIGGKVRTILDGVDLNRFASNTIGSKAFREELGLSSEDFLVCAVGQVCKRKGLLEVIDAMRRIRMLAPHAHLAIVGKVVFQHEDVYLQVLRAAARSWGVEDRIHFCGERNDVSPVLWASDLLVLNSSDEPFGLVLVEAMGCGTPVLAARVGGIPEIVTDGDSGWLVESGDTAALALKLLHLSSAKHELRRVADFAQRVTCPKFSLDRYQKELTALYATVVPRRGKSPRQKTSPAFARDGNH